MLKIKKITFLEKNKIGLIESNFDEPERPDEITVKSLASLISPGTELAWLQGYTAWIKFPYTTGYANVGEIISRGEKAEGFKEGDLIFTNGPHASYFRLKPSVHFAVKLPDETDPFTACFAIFADIAATALRSGRMELGDKVAVLGLGPIGNFAAQLLQLNGCEVAGFDLSPKRIEIAKNCGISFCQNPSEIGMEQLIQSWTGERGCDSVVEASGNSSAALDACKICRKNGEMLLLGTPRKSFNSDLTKFLFEIHIKGLTLKSAAAPLYPVKEDLLGFNKHCIERNACITLKMLAEKKLKTEPLLTKIIQPNECAEAYYKLMNQPDEFMTIAFDWKN
ncbi:MAG: hypothetical protein A2096_12220 [Spirochaetes bacterium GWF1_41_5]|nr:MAG: hypothetical protein A2096_12220 [Spirochaetes bacterium GWF1_41_5]HBE04076.1 hypothetical protein [Spirochaetia bacterium]